MPAPADDRGTTVRDALKSYLALAAGVTDITRQRALGAAKALVSQGEATAEQVTGLAEDLVAQTRQNREAVVALVGFEVDRALGRLGLATTDEVTQLTDRIRDLEAQLREAGTTAAAGAAAPAKKAPAQAAAPAPAKKAPAKKAPAKKAPAKPAPAKKAPAKKAGVQQDLLGGSPTPEAGESPA